MRILLVCRSFPPRVSGRSSHCHDLAVALKGAGHDVAVVSQYKQSGVLTPYTDGEPVAIEGVEVVGVEELGREDDIDRLTEAVRLASERFLPDVVHAHAVYPPGFSALRAVGGRVPVALTAHGGDGTRLAQCCAFHRVTSRWILQNVSGLVYVSPSYQRRVEALHGRSFPRSVVVINPVNTRHFRPRPANGAGNKNGKKPVILFHGRVERQKGIEVFLKAASLMREKRDAEFLVSGPGRYLDEAKRLARRLRLDDVLTFLGPVSYEDTPAVYHRADVYSLPTEHEGCGLTLLEAMACGLPAVSTRAAGVTDLITDGENGVLVPPNDPVALSEALRTLVDDVPRRAHLAERGRRWVEERHDWRGRVEEFLDVYRGLEPVPPTHYEAPERDPGCPYVRDPSRL